VPSTRIAVEGARFRTSEKCAVIETSTVERSRDGHDFGMSGQSGTTSNYTRDLDQTK